MKQKTIFLAGDSTVQSYEKDSAPQAGWGEKFCLALTGQGETGRIPEGAPFSEIRRYETETLAVENHAAKMRSCRTFYEEGRLKEIEQRIAPGDYLFLQFGHNDANQQKPERYVPAAEWRQWLMIYVEACRRKKAHPVLVTPIVMRNFREDGTLPVSFPEYREVMLSMADVAPVLDLGLATKEYCEKLGTEESRKRFLWVRPGEFPESIYRQGHEDDAHLNGLGASEFAGILAGLLRKSQEPELEELRKWIEQTEQPE